MYAPHWRLASSRLPKSRIPFGCRSNSKSLQKSAQGRNAEGDSYPDHMSTEDSLCEVATQALINVGCAENQLEAREAPRPQPQLRHEEGQDHAQPGLNVLQSQVLCIGASISLHMDGQIMLDRATRCPVQRNASPAHGSTAQLVSAWHCSGKHKAGQQGGAGVEAHPKPGSVANDA